jgi:hypothetical protein
MPLIWRNDKAEYFPPLGWTGGITLMGLAFLLSTRTSSIAGGAVAALSPVTPELVAGINLLLRNVDGRGKAGIRGARRLASAR